MQITIDNYKEISVSHHLNNLNDYHTKYYTTESETNLKQIQHFFLRKGVLIKIYPVKNTIDIKCVKFDNSLDIYCEGLYESSIRIIEEIKIFGFLIKKGGLYSDTYDKWYKELPSNFFEKDGIIYSKPWIKIKDSMNNILFTKKNFDTEEEMFNFKKEWLKEYFELK